MKPIIVYASKDGNTEKIANEIVQELNCESIKVTHSSLASSVNLDNYDLIFVGTGIHYGNPNEDLVNYLKTIDLSKGHRVTDDCFVCYGGWNFLRRGHPNLEDLKAVKIWTKKTVDVI
jgi:flavorubredoxin